MKNLIFLALVATALSTMSCKKAAGDKASVSDAATVESSTGTSIPVDVANSIINWEGAKPTGTHTGTIGLSRGEVVVNGSTLTGGSFTIDMNSISNTDLGEGMKERLENHLKGFAEGKEDHFFNVAKYPTASFEISKATLLEGDSEASHLVYGNLTMKGVTKEIGFKANVQVENGSVTVSTPPFTIDRTLWGVNYNSKSVFEDLGDNFVNDQIGLTINLKAGKAAI